MTNVVHLFSEDEAASNFLGSSKTKAIFKETTEKMEATIADPNKSERTKLESKMIIAMTGGDDAEFERLTGILERLTTTGITIIK